MIDNYDSFTYTLAHYFETLGQEVLVKRNDEINITAIDQLNPKYIVISPGPGTPEQAGRSVDIIRQQYQKRPILGVCLGHQAIAQAFNGEVVRANKVMHGKTSLISHNQQGLFSNLKQPLEVTRYHSLVVKPESLAPHIMPTAWSNNDNHINKELMALHMLDYPVMGVQFHPESVSTQQGYDLLTNFLSY